MLQLMDLSEKEKDQLINHMVYLVDTREKEGKNDHILRQWEQMGINYEHKKLSTGDYSFKIKSLPEFGILKDLDFSNHIMVERKQNLDEMANCCTKERERIKKEFILAPKDKILLIENASYHDLLYGNYRSNLSPKSYWATLHSFWHEYNIPFVFMPNPAESAYFIRGYFQYWLRNFLK